MVNRRSEGADSGKSYYHLSCTHCSNFASKTIETGGMKSWRLQHCSINLLSFLIDNSCCLMNSLKIRDIFWKLCSRKDMNLDLVCHFSYLLIRLQLLYSKQFLNVWGIALFCFMSRKLWKIHRWKKGSGPTLQVLFHWLCPEQIYLGQSKI